MANFKDLPSTQVGWIHELVRADIHPDAERILQLGRSFDPQQLVEESTIEFLAQLRQHLTEYAKIFNSYAENGTKFQEIKIYSIAQTAADFMMFRNQIKLVIANTAHGVIQISYSNHIRGTLAVDGQIQSGGSAPQGQQAAMSPAQELLAQLGPFHDVQWTYQGEKVNPEKIAKYYFADFARVTRDNKKSKAGNQVLLDQIKALLQEKGLEL
jgi:hypothetical protein